MQFWLANCDTFNQKVVGGVFSKCFYQPFNSSDEITVQFKDIASQNYLLYMVEDGSGWTSLGAFTEVTSGLYQKSFTPQTQGVVTNEIQLYIVKNEFEPNVASINVSGGLSSGQSQSSLSSVFTAITRPSRIQIIASSTMTGSVISATTTVFYELRMNGVVVDGGQFFLNGTSSVTNTYEVSNTEEYDQIYLLITNTSLVGSPGVHSVNATAYVRPLVDIAKSDCLSIKESHDETILINYHNNRVFASLNSSAGTPDPEFNLRVPAIFFDERHPKESESMILSNSKSSQLNAQLRRQKWLKLKPMPYYMHLKTQLALVFNTVTIDNIQWILEESYEIDPGNPRYPLKKANAWLTDKNYVLRNVL